MLTAPMSVLVQRLLRLNGKPFNIEPYPYLHAIYNTACPEVGLFTGRQVSKSTFLASDASVHGALDERGTRQIIVLPLQEQAHEFSSARMQDFLHGSPIIKNHYYMGPGNIDQVQRKVFARNGNSIIIGHASRTADRLRGYSCSKLKLDEIQDIFPDVVSVLREMTFRAVGKRSIWYCGTPKSTGNHMEGMRKRSTGAEWAVRCEATGCKKWNLHWTEKNIGKHGVICEFCGAPLKTNNGQWVQARKLDRHLGTDAKITMESYRIPQLIVEPVMSSPDGWMELATKLRSYSTERFNNEVLGLPYDSGAQPITLDQLIRCCDRDRPNTLPSISDPNMPPLCIGLDWAFVGENSYTFLVVGGWHPFPSRFEVYYWKIFKGVDANSVRQMEEVERVFKHCGIRLIGADWGAGHVQNLQLSNKLGEQHVVQMWHTGMKSGGAKNAPRAKWVPAKRRWHLDRTAVMTDMFEAIRQGRVRFPKYDDCIEFFDHLLAVTMEYSEDSNTPKYTHINPDDGAHALTYAMLTGELLLTGDFKGHTGTAPIDLNQTFNDQTFMDSAWNSDPDVY